METKKVKTKKMTLVSLYLYIIVRFLLRLRNYPFPFSILYSIYLFFWKFWYITHYVPYTHYALHQRTRLYTTLYTHYITILHYCTKLLTSLTVRTTNLLQMKNPAFCFNCFNNNTKFISITTVQECSYRWGKSKSHFR